MNRPVFGDNLRVFRSNGCIFLLGAATSPVVENEYCINGHMMFFVTEVRMLARASVPQAQSTLNS